MKIILSCLFIFLQSICFGQVPRNFVPNIKFLKQDPSSKFLFTAIDTITMDSIFYSDSELVRKSVNGIILESIVNDHLIKTRCPCGFGFTGVWKKYHESSGLAEIGRYVCNFKVDEWLYFYPNGQLRKYEYFQRFPRIDPYHGYPSGVFKENYPNGSIKTLGYYRVVEQNGSYPIVNPETYETTETCCHWALTSKKYGIWRHYNKSGKITSQMDHTFDTETEQHLRDLTHYLKDLYISER